jgi:1-acyl-sn-glycerol-3-phosphate acyltransferase
VSTQASPLRLGLVVAAGTAVALAVDAYMRFWVYPFHRKEGPGWCAGFNRAVRMWGRGLFGVARRGLRMRLVVDGDVPPPGRYLVVSNHQSSLDVPLLVTVLRGMDLKFVSMEALAKGKPAISIAIRHGGFVTVGKRHVGRDLAALTRFAARLPKYGGSPVIFPAGRLERGEGPRSFHFGGIEVLRRGSKLPILPVSIHGMADAPTLGAMSRLYGTEVRVRVFDPIPWEEGERDVRELYRRLEAMIHGIEAVAEPRPAVRAT